MRCNPRRGYGDSGNLTRVRLAIVATLFLVTISLIPAGWQAWVFWVALVAILCGTIIAIFVAGRINPPRRKRRPTQQPAETNLEDEEMEWESQRRF